MISPARIALAAVAALALTACTSGTPDDTTSASPSPSATPTATPTPTPTPKPTIPVSTSLDAIKVTGKRLESAKIEFTAPFGVAETMSKVIEPGTGRKATADGYLTMHYQGINARTGKIFDQSFTTSDESTTGTGEPVTLPLTGVISGFQKGLVGQAVGSRVLVAIPGVDGYDAAYSVSPEYAPEGYELGDTLLFVVDVVDVSFTEPEGKTVTPAAGLPTVSPGTGRPSITIPQTAAPTAMKTQVLIQGTGRAVEADDTILARYVGVSWKTGEVVDDGFTTPSAGALADTIPGWVTGLKGQKLGSRVLLVLPPADGFPQGRPAVTTTPAPTATASPQPTPSPVVFPAIEAGDTVVYVIDLLFAY